MQTASPRSRHWILVPSALRREGEALMQQQCWCWGCDARRRDEAGENPLTRSGFTRRRPPPDAHGSSTYLLNCENCEVALWAFGMLYRESEHAIFLHRFSFAPRMANEFCDGELPHIWRREQMKTAMPQCAASCAAMLEIWPRALQWMARYETQVLQTRGAAQRLNDVRGWNHRFVPPPEVPDAWEKMASRIDDCRVLTKSTGS